VDFGAAECSISNFSRMCYIVQPQRLQPEFLAFKGEEERKFSSRRVCGNTMVQHAARLLVVHFAIENGRGTSRIWETHFPNSASNDTSGRCPQFGAWLLVAKSALIADSEEHPSPTRSEPNVEKAG
jgi:hypothetical protein